MRILHHIGASASGKEVKILRKLGIQVPEFKKDAITDAFAFDLFEDSEQYKTLQPYISEFKLLDMVGTKFTDEEINTAEILAIQVQWLNGYPQPEMTYNVEKTYNCSVDARDDGYIGKVQRELFRLKKPPNWGGGKKMFSLNWIFDEIFVKKDFYETVFKKYDIEFKPLLLYKKDTVIEGTFQLVIPTTDIHLRLEKFDYEVTKKGNKLYSPKNRGFFPNFNQPVNLHIWKSKEWFGSGYQSFRRIFITQQLRQEFLKHKLKVDYIPVKN